MKYVVDLDGVRHVVELDGATARVDGGAPVAVALADVASTPLRLVSVGTAVHRVTARRDGPRGKYIVHIDGRRYAVDAVDERTRAVRDMAEASRPATGNRPLVAPMPGLVVKVHVGAGDAVSAGQPLVTIEAMKMENELRAAADGVVGEVHVAPGKPVEKGATLVSFR